MNKTATLAAMLALVAASPGGAVPNQAWYPPGYLDLREAAERQLEDFPRDPEVVLMEDWDDPSIKTYDLVDCNLGYDIPWEMEDRERVLSLLALDIARMRSEFRKLGYRREIYDGPLLEYERAALLAIGATDFEALRTEELAFLDDVPEEERVVLPASLESIAIDYDLQAELESRRERLQPDKPAIVTEGGCGAGEEEFEIRLVPANGELWLINAFAFRVCERKVANPWDHRACGWTQYLNDDSAFASGRYMYEARWGSTVKRGARVLQYDYDEDEGGVITFRRD